MQKGLENVKCAKCGKITQIERLKSGFIQDVELNGKPVNPWMIPQIEKCENCGYVGLDISKTPSGDIRDDIALSLACAWNLESFGDQKKVDDHKRNALELLEKQFSASLEADNILLYIELLREMKEFEKALDVIKSCKKEFEEQKEINPHLYSFFLFEEKLVKAKDADRHLVSEIKDSSK